MLCINFKTSLEYYNHTNNEDNDYEKSKLDKIYVSVAEPRVSIVLCKWNYFILFKV